MSKVCRNEDDDHLYIGDAIVKVNHSPLASATHDEAINAFRNAGDTVTLAVKHYRSAAPFLLRNLRQFIPEQDQNGSNVTSPVNMNDSPSTAMSSLACSRKSSKADSLMSPPASGPPPGPPPPPPTQLMDSPCSVASDASGSMWNGIRTRVRRKWVDVLEVPLMMAYITRYIFGTDKIRPNSFEVRGMNGSNTGVIHSPDIAVLSHWIKLISDYSNALTALKASSSKKFLIHQKSFLSFRLFHL